VGEGEGAEGKSRNVLLIGTAGARETLLKLAEGVLSFSLEPQCRPPMGKAIDGELQEGEGLELLQIALVIGNRPFSIFLD